jgi:DNA (cytosine-5)-methyltransferase 1
MAKQQENRAASCQPQQKRLSVGSLFAGIGGLELGLERCGMDVRWQVEIDPWARQVLAKHWPDVERHDDIKTWPKPDTERVDVICGGFPCQDISTAGKGAGLAGARSGLFFELMRVVRDLGPRYVLLENVSALLGRGMDSVLGELAQVGFDAIWHCVTASSVGAPHRRDRVFIIGYRPDDVADTRGQGAPECDRPRRSGESTWGTPETGGKTPRPSNGPPCANVSTGCRQALADTESERREEGRRLQNARTEERATGRRQALADTDSVGPQGQRANRHDARPTRLCSGTTPGGANFWAAEPAVGRVANGIPRRVDRLRGLGNAVVPQVAEFVGHLLLEINRGKIPAPHSGSAGGTVSPLRGAYSPETEKERWQEDHQQMTR